jgi:hypothetical protein
VTVGPVATTPLDNVRPVVHIPGGAHSITAAGAEPGALLAETGRYYLWGGAVCSLGADADGGADGAATPVLTPAKPAALASAFETVARPRAVRKVRGQDVEEDEVFGDRGEPAQRRRDLAPLHPLGLELGQSLAHPRQRIARFSALTCSEDGDRLTFLV